MAQRYVDAHIVLGEEEVGIWCEVCQLPARVRWPLLLMSELGVAPFGVTEHCLHCEGYDDLEEDD
jgi:hypothetical protein